MQIRGRGGRMPQPLVKLKVGRAKGRVCWLGEDREVLDKCIKEADEACKCTNSGFNEESKL